MLKKRINQRDTRTSLLSLVYLFFHANLLVVESKGQWLNSAS